MTFTPSGCVQKRIDADRLVQQIAARQDGAGADSSPQGRLRRDAVGPMVSLDDLRHDRSV